MTPTTGEAEILKQDTRGRVRVTAERRERLLDEFEESAVSAAKFARLAGIKYPTFANWVAGRRRQREAGSEGESVPRGGARPLRLFEAVLDGEPCGTSRVAGVAGLVVELPGASRVVVESPGQLQLAAELVILVAQGMRSRC